MNISRIYLVFFSCLFIVQMAMAEPQAISATNPSIAQIQTALKNHTITCEQLITFYLDRIKQYNLTTINGLAPINAITEINPNALKIAQQKDQAAASSHGAMEGKLFCVPVIIKDNIDGRGMTTTAGSYALIGTKPLKNSGIVDLLVKENAIILAKSSMDELAMGMTGISSRSGRIGNPYDTNYNPGGSSGGSAAAISANFGVIGIGTDNSGSVRIPAAYNGIYGIRPTQGLITNSGIFPMGNIDGTPGPMARNVADLALSLDVLAKKDSRKGIAYSEHLAENKTLAGKRIAAVHRVGKYDLWNNMSGKTQQVYGQVLNNLNKLGATIVELDLPRFNNDRTNNMAGTTEEVNDYLINTQATRADIAEMCASNRTHVAGNAEACRLLFAKVPSRNSAKYKEALNNITRNREYITSIMQQQQLDGLFLPIGTTGSSTYDLKTVNSWQAPVSSNSGLPSIVIPIGQNENKMPMAMEIVGKQFSESKLLGIAYVYEQHYTNFIPPNLVKDEQFNYWSVIQLNILYEQIGKLAFDSILNHHPSMTASQSNLVTKEAIKSLHYQ